MRELVTELEEVEPAKLALAGLRTLLDLDQTTLAAITTAQQAARAAKVEYELGQDAVRQMAAASLDRACWT